MCIVAIVDTDVFHRVLVSRKHDGDNIFRTWITRGHGVLAYAPTTHYRDELRKNKAIMKLIGSYRQSGYMKLVNKANFENADGHLQDKLIQSNDRYGLALALASDALVLCSNDRKFQKDFLNVKVLPKIGQRARAIYPIDVEGKKQRDFLGRRKCSKRNNAKV